ncbi:hypothetical protein LTR08_008102 [Meristemomyces frigidus]|nr:hypothetical protein LTR08_008102 [Meristemomyces frigidus]
MADAYAQQSASPDRYFNPNPGATPSNIIASYFESPITFALVGLFVLILITRAASSRHITSSPTDSKDGAAKTIPAVPYWLPFLGHIPNMAYDADGFVKGLRKHFTNGIFSLNFGGTTHHVMYTPSLATALLNQKPSVASSEDVARRLLRVVFGVPKKELPKYDTAFADLMACYKYLLGEPSLGDIVAQTARKTQTSIKDLVTGNASLVDQMPWERTNSINITKNKRGDDVVEASLLPLTRDFAAHIANPTFMGSDFLINFPDFFDNVWKVDQGFLLLATGLPRWLPIPSLTRAHIARKKIIEQISVFHTAVEKEANGEDPGPDWTNLDNVGAFVKARVVVYRKHGFSIRARAAFEHSLLWAANANSDTLVFWMLNRIYADKVLLEMLREEMEPYVRAVQPESGFPIAEPPQLENFDVDGLCANCPMLKSCYVECLRLDTASWSLKEVKQDFVLQSREKDGQGWLMRKGEYAHAAHDLHNTDPGYFDNPLVWKADRHVKYEGDDKRGTADMGSIRPYGGGASMCKGRAFAFKECMMFVAAVVAMWDIEPAGGGPWKMPRHKKATGVYSTTDDTRVWVTRRQLDQVRDKAGAR